MKSVSEKIKRSAPDNDADGAPLPSPSKQKKKPDRFNGISEEEVAMKTLPDHLGPNMDILIVSRFNLPIPPFLNALIKT